MKKIVDNVIREEYGGAHPVKDDEITLKAICRSEKGIHGRAIRVFLVGKWRLVGNTSPKGMPSDKTIKKCIRTCRFNTGSCDRYVKPHYHTKFNQNKGTFAGKTIWLKFIQIDNAC